jgi:hypothetical protein
MASVSKVLLGMALLLSGGGLNPGDPVLAQDSFQPGFWQPVARVDPTETVRLQIINQSGASLEYGLTTDESIIAELEPGDQASLGVSSLPASLNISTVSRPPFDVLSLLYEVEAVDNLVTVTVGLKDDVEGDRVVDINPDGGIYIY